MNKELLKDMLTNELQYTFSGHFELKYDAGDAEEMSDTLISYMEKTGHNILLEVLAEDIKPEMNMLLFFIESLPEEFKRQQDSSGNSIIDYAVMKCPEIYEFIGETEQTRLSM